MFQAYLLTWLDTYTNLQASDFYNSGCILFHVIYLFLKNSEQFCFNVFLFTVNIHTLFSSSFRLISHRSVAGFTIATSWNNYQSNGCVPLSQCSVARVWLALFPLDVFITYLFVCLFLLSYAFLHCFCQLFSVHTSHCYRTWLFIFMSYYKTFFLFSIVIINSHNLFLFRFFSVLLILLVMITFFSFLLLYILFIYLLTVSFFICFFFLYSILFMYFHFFSYSTSLFSVVNC